MILDEIRGALGAVGMSEGGNYEITAFDLDDAWAIVQPNARGHDVRLDLLVTMRDALSSAAGLAVEQVEEKDGQEFVSVRRQDEPID